MQGRKEKTAPLGIILEASVHKSSSTSIFLMLIAGFSSGSSRCTVASGSAAGVAQCTPAFCSGGCSSLATLMQSPVAACMRGSCPAWGHPLFAQATCRFAKRVVTGASAGAVLASASNSSCDWDIQDVHLKCCFRWLQFDKALVQVAAIDTCFEHDACNQQLNHRPFLGWLPVADICS